MPRLPDPLPAPPDRLPETDTTFDAVVIGAGFAGLYMLYRLRKLGLRVRAFETGGNVGGTWYWNRYPGARCDIESVQYSYAFSRALEQEWTWTERYAAQPEILDYAGHVADRFDLRRDVRFRTTVTTATYDEETARWRLETDRGDHVTARFLITAVGCLSASHLPDFEGLSTYRGRILHTGRWPHEPVDFSGLRVGVIGTGSSAIQSIPVIAEQARSLTVFQRTPNYSVPAWNRPLDPDDFREIRARYPELRARARKRPTAFLFPHDPRSAIEVPEKERRLHYETYWQRGGLGFLGAFADLLLDRASNDTIADFARAKIRSTVRDPEVAALLTPRNVFGCKRLCVDTGYFETYNRPDVRLVDISRQPIERFTENGLEVNGERHLLDAVVCATGFAAMTGSYDRIRITGREGRTLADKWREGPRTYLGLAVSGFPNLFTITGPGSPSVLANMIPAIEQHVDWITDCLAHMIRNGTRSLDALPASEAAWGSHVSEIASASLRSTCNSWYVGANIPGRARVFMPYIGGFPTYVDRCNQVAARGYEGFSVEGGMLQPTEFPHSRRWLPLSRTPETNAGPATGEPRKVL